MNRVDQIYEDELAIRLVLINQTDKLNLNTAAQMTERDGPCGGPACYTAFQVAGCSGPLLKRNQIVLGQIVGASNYDIGHIALGINGGGIAQLGVVGRGAKARGCTGPADPGRRLLRRRLRGARDGPPVRRQPHLQRHAAQLLGRATATRPRRSSPARGSSIMAYAGICRQDNLQPHSDPYFSQRSYDEITDYTSRERPPINEVQIVSLLDFDTNGDSFTLGYGRATTVPIVRGGNYTIAGITAALAGDHARGRDRSPSSRGRAVTRATCSTSASRSSSAARSRASTSSRWSSPARGASGFVGEKVKGGPVQNRGYFITPTGNHAPEVTTAPAYTIPLRTPFALTGSATDADNDPLTYMWEQNDVGGATGTALVNNTKTQRPAVPASSAPRRRSAPTDTLQVALARREHDRRQPDAGLPGHGADPGRQHQRGDRRLPGRAAGRRPRRCRCRRRRLLLGVPADRRLGRRARRPHAELPADRARRQARRRRRRQRGDASSRWRRSPGPFRVTSWAIPQNVYGTSPQTITWDVAGTDVGAGQRRQREDHACPPTAARRSRRVLAESTPNDGSSARSSRTSRPRKARIKIEAIGNVFFDVSHADVAIVAPPTAPVGGTVPATLSVVLGAPPAFGAVPAGRDARTTTRRRRRPSISTAGDATLSVADPSANAPGHLVNGAFSLPSALQARTSARRVRPGQRLAADAVDLRRAGLQRRASTLAFRQHIDSTDPLRTGTYSKTVHHQPLNSPNDDEKPETIRSCSS